MLVFILNRRLPVLVHLGVVQLVLFELGDQVAVKPCVPGGAFLAVTGELDFAVLGGSEPVRDLGEGQEPVAVHAAVQKER